MSKMFCWRFISTRSGNLSLANNGRKNWHDSVEHIYQISFGIKSFLLLLYKILTIQMIVVIWRVFVLQFEISAPTADLNFMHFTFLSSNHSHDYTFEIIRSGVRIKMKIVLKNRRGTDDNFADNFLSNFVFLIRIRVKFQKFFKIHFCYLMTFFIVDSSP